MSEPGKIRVRVKAITPLTPWISRFDLARVDDALLPAFSAGSHVVVEMQDGARTRMNPYSLISDPFDPTCYSICVRRDDAGRGGSLFLHQSVRVGDTLVISAPVNLFALDMRARRHLMIAGGIGITPFLAQIKQLGHLGGVWELHYACRARDLGAYADDLAVAHPDNVVLYCGDQRQRIEIEALLSAQSLGTHVYVCGPHRLIASVRETAAALGWAPETVHHEAFEAPQPGRPFSVQLARSDKAIEVGAHESLLEALEREGVDAPYLCRGGACGQCETDVIACDGTLVHRDHWLDADAKASGQKIMPCVSRIEGKCLVLDR